MRIALIDVDGHNFPNLPLMKLSAWHKHQGNNVEWYDPLTAWIDPPDKVYMSKVFTFTPDYPHPVCGGEIIRGGTGYHYPDGGDPLPKEIEHIYPDYSLYPDLCKDTAYGLNLQDGGNVVVWFGLNWSLELYQQANARLYRQGQKLPVYIHHLVVAGSVDEDVMAALEQKDDCQNALLESLKARVERYREARQEV